MSCEDPGVLTHACAITHTHMEQTLEALGALAKDRDVMSKLTAMMDGEVINKIDGYDCENRQVPLSRITHTHTHTRTHTHTQGWRLRL